MTYFFFVFSEIYCHGKLLHTIQLAKLYHDSKTFVDKKLRFKPNLVLDRFSELLNNTENNPSKEDLQFFIDEHFEDEGSEFETWEPSDWISEPDFLKKINNSILKNWGRELHAAWNFLGRKIKGLYTLVKFLSTISLIEMEINTYLKMMSGSTLNCTR